MSFNITNPTVNKSVRQTLYDISSNTNKQTVILIEPTPVPSTYVVPGTSNDVYECNAVLISGGAGGNGGGAAAVNSLGGVSGYCRYLDPFIINGGIEIAYSVGDCGAGGTSMGLGGPGLYTQILTINGNNMPESDFKVDGGVGQGNTGLGQNLGGWFGPTPNDSNGQGINSGKFGVNAGGDAGCGGGGGFFINSNLSVKAGDGGTSGGGDTGGEGGKGYGAGGGGGGYGGGGGSGGDGAQGAIMLTFTKL